MPSAIKIGVGVDAKKAIADLEKLEGKVDDVGKTATKTANSPGFKSILMGVGMGVGIAAVNMAASAIGDLGARLQQAVAGAVAQEASLARLTSSLKANAAGWDGNMEAISKVIAERTKLAFSSDEQIESLTTLVAATGDVNKALEVQRTAMDLARLKSISLASAAEYVSKAMQGQGRALLDIGIKIKSTTTGTEALAAIQAKSAGAAKDYANTTAGALAAMGVVMDDIAQSAASIFLPAMREVARFMSNDLPDALGKATLGFNYLDWASRTATEKGLGPLAPILLLNSQWAKDAGISAEDYARALNHVAEASRLSAEATAYYNQMLAGMTATVDAEIIGINAGIPIGAGLVQGIVKGVAMDAGQIRVAGVEGALAFADGADSTRSAIVANGEALIKAWRNPISVAKLRTKLEGALHSKSLIDGINSGNPALQATSMQQAIDILKYLDAMKGPAFLAGQNAAWALAKGLTAALGKLQTGGIGKALIPEITLLKRDIGEITSIFPTYAQQVAKLGITPGTIQGNKDFAAAIAMMADAAEKAEKKIGGTGTGGVAGAAKTATDALKRLADDAKTNLGAAFDKLGDSARKFFDTLHDKNLKAIDDARDLANAQLDAQIGAINEEVSAARAALRATQDARRLASLQAAVGTATTPEAAQAAQDALSDFLAEQNISRLETEAKAKIDVLELQKKANNELAAEQTKAEEARYAAQVKGFEKEFKALETYLAKHPEAWKATSAKVIALLETQGVTYTAAGEALGAAFAKGLKAQEAAVRKAAMALAEAAADVLKVKSPTRAGPLAEDQSKWGERLALNWAMGLERGMANISVPALGGVASALQAPARMPVAAGASLALAPGAIVVNGAGDPEAVARSVMQALKRETQRQGMTLA